jgi:hypothetical protein
MVELLRRRDAGEELFRDGERFPECLVVDDVRQPDCSDTCSGVSFDVEFDDADD